MVLVPMGWFWYQQFVYLCTYTFVEIHVCGDTHLWRYTFVHIYICFDTHLCTYTYIYAYDVHIPILMHIYTHSHTLNNHVCSKFFHPVQNKCTTHQGIDGNLHIWGKPHATPSLVTLAECTDRIFENHIQRIMRSWAISLSPKL